MPTMFFWLRRQWLEAISVWRKAPICFSLGALFGGGMVLSVVPIFCGATWMLSVIRIPLAEYLNPGIEAFDSWALGVTYWIYFMIALNLACIVFLAAALWRVSRKTPRDMEQRESARPARSGGQVPE